MVANTNVMKRVVPFGGGPFLLTASFASTVSAPHCYTPAMRWKEHNGLTHTVKSAG